MLQRFRRKSNRTDKNESAPAISQHLMDKVVELQHKTANILNKKVNGWQTDRVKVALIIFCLLFGTASLLILAEAIWSPKAQRPIKMPVGLPGYVLHPKREEIVTHEFISKKEYDRIERFRRYIDSLGTTIDGRSELNSLLAGRPKLMDSLAVVEQLYNKQK